MTNLYFLSLFGQDENDGGCYALIIDDDILLFDAGAKRPFQNTLGVKVTPIEQDGASFVEGLLGVLS